MRAAAALLRRHREPVLAGIALAVFAVIGLQLAWPHAGWLQWAVFALTALLAGVAYLTRTPVARATMYADVRRVRLRPGDKLVIWMDDPHPSMYQVQTVREAVRAELGAVPLLVLPAGMEIGVLTPQEEEQCTS